jgi:hypothetical protein
MAIPTTGWNDGNKLTGGSLNEIAKFVDNSIVQSLKLYKNVQRASTSGVFPSTYITDIALVSGNNATSTFEIPKNSSVYYKAFDYDKFDDGSFNNTLWTSGPVNGSHTIWEIGGSFFMGISGGTQITPPIGSAVILSSANFSGCSYLVVEWNAEATYAGGGNSAPMVAFLSLTNNTTGSMQQIGSIRADTGATSVSNSGLFIVEFLSNGSYSVWRPSGNEPVPVLYTTLYGLGADVRLKFTTKNGSPAPGTSGMVHAWGHYAGFTRTGSTFSAVFNSDEQPAYKISGIQGISNFELLDAGSVTDVNTYYSRWSVDSGATFTTGSINRMNVFNATGTNVVMSAGVTGTTYPAIITSYNAIVFDFGANNYYGG